MFEKSLYDLIRGLRKHKGNEKEYIQDSLKECRVEIKSQDMDMKATALLKLIYLEMFGHDMSWASFHVLEVMSSAKYLQKRVGYLGAVQSFRSDTEVLMLATNLLKKDLTSPLPLTMALPIGALPHIITPSLALSLIGDLLPRLSSSHAAIRKKTIATLFRLALVHPETLRPAWPKIKERLMDGDEDPSVTAAVVNVVCELGWRRPQDFLQLAPRLFDLLVEGSNNWMAIKIIKLFATLIPLEPRLTRKLLPPLTNLIRTTQAMSLLYECINGVIQSGILDGSENDSDEIAILCADKLRGMILLEGDPNLKYVALLSLNKIVLTRPFLVTMQQDVILDCLDDFDISIRIQALDLLVGMVNSDNLQYVVERLINQLRLAPYPSAADDPMNDRSTPQALELTADSDEEDPEEALRPLRRSLDDQPPLPDEYRLNVITKILMICSRDMYSFITDFEWYIRTLVELVRLVPAPSVVEEYEDVLRSQIETIDTSEQSENDIASSIGSELLNVAVRVKSVRLEATRAAESLVLIDNRPNLFPSSGNGGQGVLKSAVWIVGEYAEYLLHIDDVLSSLIHASNFNLPSSILVYCVQAIPKVFAQIVQRNATVWTPERETMITFTLRRIVRFLESLSTHPSLEVQERSIEFLEYMKLAAESLTSEGRSTGEPPLLLTHVLPSLFNGFELNPVAPGAVKKVPMPEGLDLDAPIHSRLAELLQTPDVDSELVCSPDEFDAFYYTKPSPTTVLDQGISQQKYSSYSDSYQASRSATATPEDPELSARRRAERRERNRDDPFFLGGEDSSASFSQQQLTPPSYHNILNSTNEKVDIDSIPIMALDLGPQLSRPELPVKKKARKKIDIALDETIEEPFSAIGSSNASGHGTPESYERLQSQTTQRRRRALLGVDSSGLGGISLEDGDYKLDVERKQKEEQEMAEAMKEVERLRLEMQRASERVTAVGVPEGGEIVKRKKKKVRDSGDVDIGGKQQDDPGSDLVGKKKKKKKKKTTKKTKIRKDTVTMENALNEEQT